VATRKAGYASSQRAPLAAHLYAVPCVSAETPGPYLVPENVIGRRDQTDQQPASTTASQEVPGRPTATEVDIIAGIRKQCHGIRKQCQKYASTGFR
jgi:hypothetical protein